MSFSGTTHSRTGNSRSRQNSGPTHSRTSNSRSGPTHSRTSNSRSRRSNRSTLRPIERAREEGRYVPGFVTILPKGTQNRLIEQRYGYRVTGGPKGPLGLEQARGEGREAAIERRQLEKARQAARAYQEQKNKYRNLVFKMNRGLTDSELQQFKNLAQNLPVTVQRRIINALGFMRIHK